MLTIRLQRVGRKNQPVFRIVLAEKHRAVKKQAVEILGHYNPHSKEFGVKDEARLKYWIAQRVEISPTVHNLLVSKGLLEGKKVQAWRPKPKKKEEQKPAEQQAAEAPKAEAKKEEVKGEEKKETPKAEAKAEAETAAQASSNDQAPSSNPVSSPDA